MTKTIDDETRAMIQSFTSWAQGRGYHVIGALIGPKGEAMVKVFSTSPVGDQDAQISHAKKLLDIVNHTMKLGKSEVALNLPLETN